MPDDLDYEWLRELIAHPERWTDSDASSVRSMIANQTTALAEMHRRDAKGRRAAQAVVRELDAALEKYVAHRRKRSGPNVRREEGNP